MDVPPTFDSRRWPMYASDVYFAAMASADSKRRCTVHGVKGGLGPVSFGICDEVWEAWDGCCGKSGWKRVELGDRAS